MCLPSFEMCSGSRESISSRFWSTVIETALQKGGGKAEFCGKQLEFCLTPLDLILKFAAEEQMSTLVGARV
jgi:hypothetical protein